MRQPHGITGLLQVAKTVLRQKIIYRMSNMPSSTRISNAHTPRWSLSTGIMPTCSLKQEFLMCLLYKIETAINFRFSYMNYLLFMSRLAVALLN